MDAMTPTDFIFGMNWVDQLSGNLRDYHPTIRSLIDDEGWDALNWMRWWDGTPQGSAIWRARHRDMLLHHNHIHSNTLLR